MKASPEECLLTRPRTKFLLWMDRILHHFEHMRTLVCWILLVFTGESAFQDLVQDFVKQTAAVEPQSSKLGSPGVETGATSEVRWDQSSEFMAMGHDPWLHFGVDEHPFAILMFTRGYNQGCRVLTHSHILLGQEVVLTVLHISSSDM